MIVPCVGGREGSDMSSTTAVLVAGDYNGWSNRETWLASLWLTNDESSYYNMLRVLKQDSDCFTKAESLEALLRLVLEDKASEASFWSDLLNSAFSRIDWVEIVENNL